MKTSDVTLLISIGIVLISICALAISQSIPTTGEWNTAVVFFVLGCTSFALGFKKLVWKLWRKRDNGKKEV